MKQDIYKKVIENSSIRYVFLRIIYDHLTGLYNRRFFDIEMQRLNIERNLPLALIVSDVNGLKLTNDDWNELQL